MGKNLKKLANIFCFLLKYILLCEYFFEYLIDFQTWPIIRQPEGLG